MNSADSLLNWQRTSAIAVVFYLLRAARRFVTDGLPAMAVILATYASAGESTRALMATGVIAAMGIGIIVSILAWLRFRYCIAGDRVLVRSGILHREELSVEFNRIQNISIREPFYMRPFSLALLSIDTAGSGKKEIVLGGIRESVARSLRETILSKTRHPEVGEKTNEQVDEDAPSLLLSRSSKDIVIYGLTINFILWFLIAVGAVFGAQDLSEKIFQWLASRIQLEQVLAVVQGDGSVFTGILIMIGGLLLLLLLLPTISVIGALFRHYGYRLSVEGETYRKNSGLLTRHDESLKRHKIQAVIWKQNFMARVFRRTNIHLRMASAGSAYESGQLPTGPKTTFIVPALNDGQVSELSAEFLPGCDAESAVYSRIDRRRFFKVILGFQVLPPTLLVTILLMLVASWKFVVILPLAVTFTWALLERRWRKMGYAVAGDHGFIRHGLVGSETTVFPLFKVQRVDIRQTPGQNRRGLAHLVIHLASHSLKLPHVKVADAQLFRDLALYHVESTNRPWY